MGHFMVFFSVQREVSGNPIFPLLFVICMEYLTKVVLKKASDHPRFQYHPKCKAIKLYHLVFVNDVIMCCGGNFHSIYLMLQAFKLFSCSSGFCINEHKLEIYSAIMGEEDIQRVNAVYGLYHYCTIPFKYLGVPIAQKESKQKSVIG